MKEFCTLFFHTSVRNYGTIIDQLPELSQLEMDLVSVSEIYNDSTNSSRRGIGFYFSYQGKWSESMLEHWRGLSLSFVRRLKKALWRPRKKRNEKPCIDYWRVTLRMPKLHSLLLHVAEFVKLTGYWAILSEESFEHYQQTSKYLRLRHSHNISTGAQLCSDLHYAWLRSLPVVKSLQASAEEIAFTNNPRLRKRRHLA